MKIILTLSIAAMISAGIYGATDMLHDVASGKMIRYNDGIPDAQKKMEAEALRMNSQRQKAASRDGKMMMQAIAGRAATERPEPVRFKASEFSRGDF
ncbi:MAG TPA: hypothetical protein VFU15_13335 [Bacteroidia bacterium]|nr:hypothetical protein [Bacteroidia bacterium]